MFDLLYILSILGFLIFMLFRRKRFEKKMLDDQKDSSQLELRVTLVVLLLFSFINFSNQIDNRGHSYIPLTEDNFASKFFHQDSVRPVIKEYSSTTIRSIPSLFEDSEKSNSHLSNWIEPRQNIPDAALFLIVSIVCIVSFWKFDFRQPFDGKLSKTLFLVGLIFWIFLPIDMLRTYIMDIIIRKKTNDDYTYVNPYLDIDYLKVFVGAILIRVAKIVRKGETLQKEQELTV
jgi:hypothetical protein